MIAADNFDFAQQPLVERGPNLTEISKMTPRKLADTVLLVFNRLGGATWLLDRANADPKGFMDLLKKILPNNLSVDGLDNFQITLIDQFGNAAQLSGQSSGQDSAPRQIATGGNPADAAIPLPPTEVDPAPSVHTTSAVCAPGEDSDGLEPFEIVTVDSVSGCPAINPPTPADSDEPTTSRPETATGGNHLNFNFT